MKIITANRLIDGAVVYVSANGALVEQITHATLFDDETALAELDKTLARTNDIANAYSIEATAQGPAGREALRETIRSAGPTVRRDLGKQSEVRDERL